MDYFWGSKPGGGLDQRFLKLQGSVSQVSTLGLRVPEMELFGRWTSLGKMDRPGGAVVGGLKNSWSRELESD